MASHSSIATAKDGLPHNPSERLLHTFQRFGRLSSAGGVLLLLATVAALVWANSPAYESYHNLFHTPVHLTVGSWELPHIHSVAYFINDALMAFFFLLVGLEIKREMVVGELRSPKRAALPIAGAIGGMVVPALIYVFINTIMKPEAVDGVVPKTMNGWGIPMATDIAFALGVMTLLGKRVPLGLKVFLTSLAIVDDLGALIVIALFYTEKLATEYLLLAGLTVGVMAVMNMLRFRSPLFYVVPGIALWLFVLSSGVHATIAGVLMAATIPATARVNPKRFVESTRAAVDHFEREGDDGSTPRESAEQRAAAYVISENVRQVIPPLHRMENALHGWCIFMIIPVFALANAGLHLAGDFGKMAVDPVTLGVFFGLLIGKPVGIVGASLLACKMKLAELPTGATMRHMIGAGCLGGIGFTMALFIAGLAFKSDAMHLDASKLGILSASVVATIAGVAILLSCKPMTEAQALTDADATAPEDREYAGHGPAQRTGMPIAKKAG